MDTDRFSGIRDLGLLSICNPNESLLRNPVGGNLGSSSGNPMISVGGTPIFERGLVLTTTLRYPGSINYESSDIYMFGFPFDPPDDGGKPGCR